jgi:hypothetical protein
MSARASIAGHQTLMSERSSVTNSQSLAVLPMSKVTTEQLKYLSHKNDDDDLLITHARQLQSIRQSS